MLRRFTGDSPIVIGEVQTGEVDVGFQFASESDYSQLDSRLVAMKPEGVTSVHLILDRPPHALSLIDGSGAPASKRSFAIRRSGDSTGWGHEGQTDERGQAFIPRLRAENAALSTFFDAKRRLSVDIPLVDEDPDKPSITKVSLGPYVETRIRVVADGEPVQYANVGWVGAKTGVLLEWDLTLELGVTEAVLLDPASSAAVRVEKDGLWSPRKSWPVLPGIVEVELFPTGTLDVSSSFDLHGLQHEHLGQSIEKWLRAGDIERSEPELSLIHI